MKQAPGNHREGLLADLVARHKAGDAVGVPSVCSSNRYVLAAVAGYAKETGTPLLVEATANQCNQFGGYTGLVPDACAAFVKECAHSAGLAADRLVIGGDHLGPTVWQKETAAAAMKKAVELVSGFAAAGFKKIHLDASMRCADDPADGRGLLDIRTAAERTAELAGAAEESFRRGPSPVSPLYVIGSDVPQPGGVEGDLEPVSVTRLEDVVETFEETRKAFRACGLDSAWERVIAMVVQPGVEFGNNGVLGYDRRKAAPLAVWIAARPGMVFEAHSTDYQTEESLRNMVRDHFAVLKVGPWLTFAFREAVFAMAALEEEWLGRSRKSVPSSLLEIVDGAMVKNPEHWKKHYGENPGDAAMARKYSPSDRIRYYWNDPAVAESLQRLFGNLSRESVPWSLLSQYMPNQADAVREGRIPNTPNAWVRDKILSVYRIYVRATRTGCAASSQGE